MVYHQSDFQMLRNDPSVDVVIWTFRNNVTVTRNPKMYGWVKVDDHDHVIQVCCKTPISETPIQDHAVIGTFYFKKAAYFFDAAEEMIRTNHTINGEFYVDVAINYCVKAGLSVKVFEVQYYICWGTPNDLRVYHYWENCLRKAPWHPYSQRNLA